MELKYNLEPETYCCEYSLLSDALNTLEYVNKNKSDNFSSITILGYEDIIERLLKAVCQVRFQDSDAELSFHHLDYDYVDYDGEYALLLTLEDCYAREFTISVEKAKYEDGTYKTYEQDYLYIDDACSEELVKKHLQFENTMDFFEITEECEEDIDESYKCDGDCENCELGGDDEKVSLYNLVEDIVDTVLSEKYGV
jgi:hypothetical protein